MAKISMNNFALRKVRKLLKQVNALAEPMAKLTDEQLQAKTPYFKQKIAAGTSLDKLLPEAFAAMREADRRILKMFPFDVQVMGGIVLHQGNVAEMRTGEGKTLTATLPLYLNALSGKGTFLITTNEYLASRDCAELKKVYQFMGLTCCFGVLEDKTNAKPELKRKIYAHDIVYTTNSALGFDYLIDNLAKDKAGKYMRPFNYAIIDEADQVLLDTAQMPLIIAGAPRVQSNQYTTANIFVTTLKRQEDYELDEEETNVWLTEKGVSRAQEYYGIKNIFTKEHHDLLKHIILALRVNVLMKRGKDYVVQDGEVKLLDKKDGRVMEGNKLEAGMHQAIEAKEAVEITPAMRAMASITYQNFFRMFPKIAGMTGTGKVAEEEFINTYYMKVVQIPTNRPVKRKDLPDRIYVTLPEKLLASLEVVKKIHATGQPVLIATASVEISEIYSELLLREKIPHSVLNAVNIPKEAEIIKEAGQLGAVTVATLMAGRGTDIKLGPGVKELGGLAVIGTEKLASKRDDLQLRGRSGRQGDPGLSLFFTSLEDEVVIKYGLPWIHEYYDKNKDFDWDQSRQLTKRKIRRALEGAQKMSDHASQKERESSLEFDESLRIQREIIYTQRDELINSQEIYDVEKIITAQIDKFLQQHPMLDKFTLSRYIYTNLSYHHDGDFSQLDLTKPVLVKKYLLDIAKKELAIKSNQLANQTEIANFYRTAILRSIDACWIEEVDNLQQLRTVVRSRVTAQRQPMYEYHREAFRSYQKMKEAIQQKIVKNLLLSSVVKTKKGNVIYFV